MKFLFVLALFTAFASTKASLKHFSESLQSGEKITSIFKEKKDSSGQFKILEKQNATKASELLKLMTDSQPFQRGEIEDEKVLNGTLIWLQYCVIESRNHPQQRKQWLAPWFQFAADLSYEEASLIALRFSAVIRSLLLDEIEDKVASGEASDEWVKRIRAPWPIDRVIISESRRTLKPASLVLADRIALDLQKNPYQTVEDSMKKLGKETPREMEFLKKLWRTQDIQSMKEEITRIGRLQLSWAKARFKAQKGHFPTSVKELLAEKLLDHAPIDYVSGREITL